MSLYLGETPIASTGYDKANTDLSNLTNTGKNIANWSNNVTNCITEIPQDIKLELNNGTLTLKAGSKIYNGNGLITTTDVDILHPTASVNDTVFLIYVPSTNSLGTAYMTGESVSSLPTPTTSYKLYYNTTDRKCYIDNGTWLETSFPLAITTSTTTQFVSIDQVFNGFGYIGSTVFALPNVKGLIPNGRNADGTLKNTNMLLNKVCMLTLSGGWSSNNQQFTITKDGDIGTNVFTYNEYENYVMYQDEKQEGLIFAQGKITNTKIDNIYFKTAFHALDYNDSSTISGWGMPSSRYIDLTLGASPATYTAPANGYFAIASTFNQNGILFMYSNSPRYGNSYTYNQNAWTEGILFVKKGYSVNIQYNGTPSLQYFRFIYAEGEN